MHVAVSYCRHTLFANWTQYLRLCPEAPIMAAPLLPGCSKAYLLWEEENHAVPGDELSASLCCNQEIEGSAALKAVIRHISLVALVGENASRVPFRRATIRMRAIKIAIFPRELPPAHNILHLAGAYLLPLIIKLLVRSMLHYKWHDIIDPKSCGVPSSKYCDKYPVFQTSTSKNSVYCSPYFSNCVPR